MDHCFSYFTQAYHNSWIKYDNFDSIHCCGFIRNTKRDWGTKSSLFLHKLLFLKISFYLNRTASCATSSAFLAISSSTSNNVYFYFYWLRFEAIRMARSKVGRTTHLKAGIHKTSKNIKSNASIREQKAKAEDMT